MWENIFSFLMVCGVAWIISVLWRLVTATKELLEARGRYFRALAIREERLNEKVSSK